MCSQFSYQFSAPSSGFLPWHVQATGTEDNFCPFPAWRWHVTPSLLLLLTPVSASAKKTGCSSANSSRGKRERERGREWFPTLQNFLEGPAKKMQQAPFNFHWGREKKEKRKQKKLLPLWTKITLGMISFWFYLLRVCIFILDGEHLLKQWLPLWKRVTGNTEKGLTGHMGKAYGCFPLIFQILSAS